MTDIRTRAQWGARAGLGPLMALPARRFFVHHSVTNITSDPDRDVRTVEDIGVDRFGRMSYSWLSHPGRTGLVYEGAGLTIGAHTGGHNSTSFAACLVGNYDNVTPSDAQLHDVAGLYARLVREGHLRPGSPIDPHQLVKATGCPGRRMMARLGELRALAHDMTTGRTPAPQPPATRDGLEETLSMLDTLDLTDAHRTPVRGRHVDNLQGLLTAVATWEPMRPCHPGALDGIAGNATRQGLLEFQGRAKYLGAYTGAIDGIVGPGTWRALVTF